MGTIKDKNGRDLVDTEKIKKRWKGYTEELYKKDLNEPDYCDSVVSHLEPDILECEVKWALRSTAVNKASGCGEISAELFKSLKHDAIKVLHSLRQKIWKTQLWSQDWKRSILIPIPKKGSTKECANHWSCIHLHMLVRSYLKSCMLGFSIMWINNFQMSKLGLEKEEELKFKLPTFSGLERKQGNFRKRSISVSSTTITPLTVWIMTNCGKPLERWEYQSILPVSWETCMRSRSNSYNSVWNTWLVQDRETSTTGLSAVTLFV